MNSKHIISYTGRRVFWSSRILRIYSLAKEKGKTCSQILLTRGKDLIMCMLLSCLDDLSWNQSSPCDFEQLELECLVNSLREEFACSVTSIQLRASWNQLNMSLPQHMPINYGESLLGHCICWFRAKWLNLLFI